MIHTLNKNIVYLEDFDNKKVTKEELKLMTALEFKNEVLPFKNKLFRFALSYLKSVEDAKDVVQEVLIKAWEYLTTKGAIYKIEAWCMTAVKNKCLDFLKRKGRHTVDVNSQNQLAWEEQSPLEQLDVKYTLDKVKVIISYLPSLQQEILHLRDIEGYSYKKIADVLKIEMNLVKVNIFRARQFIKQRMSKIEAYGI